MNVIDALEEADPSKLTRGLRLKYFFTDYLGLALKSVTDEQAQTFLEACGKYKDADEALR